MSSNFREHTCSDEIAILMKLQSYEAKLAPRYITVKSTDTLKAINKHHTSNQVADRQAKKKDYKMQHACSLTIITLSSQYGINPLPGNPGNELSLNAIL